MFNKTIRVLSSLATAGLVALSTANVNAHVVSWAWDEQANGDIEFYLGSYHTVIENASDISTNGLILNGTNFSFDTQENMTTQANWNTLVSGLDGVANVPSNTPSMQRYGTVLVEASDLVTLGFGVGSNNVTLSSFAGNAVYYPWSPVNTNINWSGPAVVSEPASLALLGLGLAGLGFQRRRRTLQS